MADNGIVTNKPAIPHTMKNNGYAPNLFSVESILGKNLKTIKKT